MGYEEKQEWITVRNVAKMLSLSVPAVYNLCKDQKIPHYRFGKAIRFKEAEIVEYMQRAKVEPKIEVEQTVTEEE